MNLKTSLMTRLRVPRRKVERETCQMALSSGPLLLPFCCRKASVSETSPLRWRLPFLFNAALSVCLRGEETLALGPCNRLNVFPQLYTMRS